MKKFIVFFALICGAAVWVGSAFLQNPQIRPLEQSNRIKLSLPAKFINSAVTRSAPFKPVFLLVKPLATDKPVVHPLIDFYQFAKDFEDLFSKSGRSMLCAPSSLANVLVYLKVNHVPKFEKIGAKHDQQLKTNGDWVDWLFKLCRTDKETGTYAYDMEDAAKTMIAEGGYGTDNIFLKGYWSTNKKQIMSITPAILKSFSAAPDRGIVVQFGWYSVVNENNKKIYKRNGGHCVALAGYDALNPNIFYVSNPLVDYSQIYPLRYSKVTLKKLPADVEAPEDTAWYTDDLIGGNFAILELILVVLPQLKFSAPTIAR